MSSSTISGAEGTVHEVREGMLRPALDRLVF